MDIFSDSNETEMVKRLCKEDAQSLVDVVDEVLPHSFISGHSTDFNLDFPSSVE